MAGKQKKLDLRHTDAFEKWIHLGSSRFGLVFEFRCVCAQSKIHDGFGLLDFGGISILLLSMQLISSVKLFRKVGIHYPGVIPVNYGTKRVVALEKVWLGTKTQPANDFSNTVHHEVILALAVKMCVPRAVQLLLSISQPSGLLSLTAPHDL